MNRVWDAGGKILRGENRSTQSKWAELTLSVQCQVKFGRVYRCTKSKSMSNRHIILHYFTLFSLSSVI